MSRNLVEQLKEAQRAARDAASSAESAASAADDAAYALRALLEKPENLGFDAREMGKLDRLFLVVRSIVNQDGVFDLYDLALASADAEKVVFPA